MLPVLCLFHSHLSQSWQRLGSRGAGLQSLEDSGGGEGWGAQQACWAVFANTAGERWVFRSGGLLEIFSSSESISTSKLKASDGWQASSCGRPPAGTGEGVGAEGTVLRCLLAGREVSLALLKPVVPHIDSGSWSASSLTWEGWGRRVEVGQGG